MPLYARAGITEAWVVDVEEKVIRVFRDPTAKGYQTSITASVKEKIAVPGLPKAMISVADLFPSF